MVLAYPTQRNFDAWTSLGNRGWTHKDIAPYYKKFQTFTPASKETSEQLHLDSYLHQQNQGFDGPLSASYLDVYGPFNEAWNAAFRLLGFNDQSDPILGQKLGAFAPPNTVNPKTRKRDYSATAYLNEEVESRSNLHVITETQVLKVLLSGKDGSVEAEGIEVRDKDGQIFDISAGEVILAAGSFQSPQILENSGIGLARILQRYGIPVVINNPGVGENLQDHSMASICVEAAEGQMTMDLARDPAVVEALLKQYQETQSGPLSGVPLMLAYTPPVDIHGLMGRKDLARIVKENVDLSDPALNAGLKAQYTELVKMLLDPAESACFNSFIAGQQNIHSTGRTSMPYAYSQALPENYVNICAGLNHPFSRGSVHIQSSDPAAPPAINPNYLSHPLDLELMGRAVQNVENIIDHLAFHKILKPENRVPPISDLSDLDNAKQIAKDRLWSTYHPSCTCAMMPRHLGGVVDDRLVVHGTKNVRVIDASIFPMITLGNIQATVYAVAEKACDLIKEDWAGQL